MLRLLPSTLEWPYVQAQVFLANMRACMSDHKMHAYLPVTVMTAQKPLHTSSGLNPGPGPDPGPSAQQ